MIVVYQVMFEKKHNRHYLCKGYKCEIDGDVLVIYKDRLNRKDTDEQQSKWKVRTMGHGFWFDTVDDAVEAKLELLRSAWENSKDRGTWFHKYEQSKNQIKKLLRKHRHSLKLPLNCVTTSFVVGEKP
jgi:hypothetical protein